MGVRSRAVRWAARLVGAALAVWAATALLVLLLSATTLAGHQDGRSLDAPVDAAIVLGGGVDGDGELGYASRRRVAAAVATWQAGKARALIVSGGATPRNPASAAELMRDHAVRLGVPAESVLVESRATSTFENLRFAFAIAKAAGMERLALVSDAYHLPRAQALAGYFGEPDAGLVAVPGLAREGRGERVWAILREALAWWYNLYKVAAWEGLSTLGLGAAERAEWVR